MWPHALLTFYRALTRHRLYAALNIVGLAVGIAVFLVLSLDVAFETSFERWIPDAPSIYLVSTGWLRPGHAVDIGNNTMGGLLDELHQDYSQLIGTRVWDVGAIVRQGAQNTAEQVELVDPTFFKVLDLPLVSGDRDRLLKASDEILLSETRAKRYFGGANPIGRRLTISLNGKLGDYRVAGVLKDTPKNSDLAFNMVALLTPQMGIDEGRVWRHWGSQQLSTYLRFDTPAAAAAFNADLDRFTDRHAGADLNAPAHATMQLRARPLVSLHLIDPKDAAVTATIGVVGLLTLLLAGVNYVNLATARAGLRAREVALRKVMGATASDLVWQFMIEALATTALAALIGLALCELVLPVINSAGGLSLRIAYLGPDSILPFIGVVVVIVGVAAGAYPALLLSRFQPAQVLAAARTPGGGRSGARVREGLVIFQFAVAIAFTIATGVIVSQSRYLRHADLGFKRDGLVVVTSFSDPEISAAQRTSLLTAWRAIPGVTHVTNADMAPGNEDSTSGNNFKRPGMAGDGPTLNWVGIGPDFFAAYGARLLAGRVLDQNHGLDQNPPKPQGATPEAWDAIRRGVVRNVVLNANGLKPLGFKSPQDAIGQTILEGLNSGFQTMTIVGVVDNFRFRSPKKPVPPTIYLFDSRTPDGVVGVRYEAATPRAVLDRLQATFRAIAPDVPFRAKTIEDNLEPYYKSDDQRGRLFTIGASLAVAIGCVGLYGLASFNTARRVKEIGIRKTLGASTADIQRLLIGQFLRPVLIANLIAWPLAYVVMRSWLEGFDQCIALNPLYFLAATLLTVVVAVGTVAGQAFNVARAEPAKALRNE